MRTTHAAGRLALTVLITSLALAGCSAHASSEPASETHAPETDIPATEAPAADEPDVDPSNPEAAGEADRVGEIVSFSFPDGWVEESEMIESAESLPFIDESLMYSDSDSTSPTPRNVTIMVNAPNPNYLDVPFDAREALEAEAEEAGRPTTLQELPPTTIDGIDVVGYEVESDYGQGVVRQHSYSLLLDTGRLISIVFTDVPDEFDAHQDDFDSILESIDLP